MRFARPAWGETPTDVMRENVKREDFTHDALRFTPPMQERPAGWADKTLIEAPMPRAPRFSTPEGFVGLVTFGWGKVFWSRIW